MMTLVKEPAESGTIEPTGVERRRGLRIAQNRPVKIFEPSIARYYGGQTEDVSATGLRIELPMSAPVQRGKLLSIHVGVGDSGQALANRREMIPARVVWIKRDVTRRDGRMTAGVEFLASIAVHRDAA
jgi:hypothetical protein